MSVESPAPPPASGPLGEEALVDLLLEEATVPVAVYDPDGRRIRANESATSLLGRDRTAGASDAAIAIRVAGDVLERGEAAHADEVTSSDGDVVTRSWHGQAIRRRDGQLAGALLIGDDPGRTARLEALALTDGLTGVLNHG